MSPTDHGSNAVFNSARRFILSIFRFLPQPIKRLCVSVFPSLEPKISSTDHGSTVYDIIFAGGYFKLYSIRVEIVLTRMRPGGAAACVTAGRLAEADPSLRILVRFQKKFLDYRNFFLIPNRLGRGSWSTYP